jgi:8-oxo-dGTP pyrophosphatase MutT (NUDIX family)
MTGIRHFTASAIVLDDTGQRVLLVHHNKLQRWLYPGGHVDANEDPAQAALREVREETGIIAEVICAPLFAHPAVATHAPPYTIIEMQVNDAKVGVHRHIDFVYVMRSRGGDLAVQLEEVGDSIWVPIADLVGLDTPAELPALVADAAQWAKIR